MLDTELDKETVCDIGEVSPFGKMKLSELGVAESGLATPDEFALRVTGMESVVLPDTTLTKPTCAPDVGAPEPIDTVTKDGVVALEAVATSQLPSEKAETATLAVPLAEESRTVCGGVVTPVWVLKVSCCGVATTALVCAAAVSKQHNVAAISPKVGFT